MSYQLDDLLGRPDLIRLLFNAQAELARLRMEKSIDRLESADRHLLARHVEWRIKQIERAMELTARTA